MVKGGTSDKWSKVRTTNKSGLAGHKELIKEDQVGHQPQWGQGQVQGGGRYNEKTCNSLEMGERGEQVGSKPL